MATNQYFRDYYERNREKKLRQIKENYLKNKQRGIKKETYHCPEIMHDLGIVGMMLWVLRVKNITYRTRCLLCELINTGMRMGEIKVDDRIELIEHEN